MKLKDIRIGVQLRIGLGAILFLVALLGAMAWIQADTLWQETQGLYEHPLMVRRALGEVNADILSMQGRMKDLVLADNDLERGSIIQALDIDEANAIRQFDILYDRYLGQRSDIDEVYHGFIQWKAIRAEIQRLLSTGNIADAASRIKPAGLSGSHMKMLTDHIQDISEFATAKGDQFYQAAQKEREDLRLRLGIVTGIILLVSMGLSYLLLQGIRTPLKDLTLAAEQFRTGDNWMPAADMFPPMNSECLPPRSTTLPKRFRWKPRAKTTPRKWPMPCSGKKRRGLSAGSC